MLNVKIKTKKGEINFYVLEADGPMTLESFLFLVKEGF